MLKGTPRVSSFSSKPSLLASFASFRMLLQRSRGDRNTSSGAPALSDPRGWVFQFLQIPGLGQGLFSRPQVKGSTSDYLPPPLPPSPQALGPSPETASQSRGPVQKDPALLSLESPYRLGAVFYLPYPSYFSFLRKNSTSLIVGPTSSLASGTGRSWAREHW